MSALVPIISGKRCIGFLPRRGREGVEAFDADERSLGCFPDPITAAAAVEAAARKATCTSCEGGE
jgi:hypothetical protein